MSHKTTTGAEAIHPVSFVSDMDPALDADNHVTARKMWFDTTIDRMKVRNEDNDDWLLIGGE